MADLRLLFENADSAEWALSDLRTGGVEVSAFRIDNTARPGTETGFPFLFSAGMRADSFGSYVPGPYDDADRRHYYDTHSAEVILSLLVPDEQAEQARATLVSRHGRPI